MKRKTFWGFTAPSLVAMVVLMVFPFVTTLWLSFHNLQLTDLKNPKWIGLSNYSDILGDPEFWGAVRFTLLFVAVTVPIAICFGLGVALLLDRVTKGRAFFMAALLLPFIVTPVVGSLLYRDLFDRGGLLAWIYELITDESFAVDRSNVRWLIFTHAVWAAMPFSMITFFAGLQTLPEERVEAAALDGAGFWRNLWHVTLPHLRVVLIFVVLVAIMDAYRVYDSVFVFAGERFKSSHSLQVYTVRTATDPNIGQLGRANAISMLTVVGIFVVLIPFLYRSYKDQIAERA